MQFVFLSAHKVLGITHRSGDPDVLLFNAAEPQTKVILTRNLYQHWHILDRHVALASMMLGGMFGRSPGEFSERLEQEMQAVRERRSKTVGSDSVLLIEIRGEIDVNIRDPKREVDDLILCFDAYDKKELKISLQNRVAAILAAMRIGGKSEYGLESIAEDSYLLKPDGKVVYSFSLELGTPTLYVSSPITDEDVSQIHQHIELILKEKNLLDVVRLFAYSLDRNTDELRTFISAWSAMEIFINKVFPQYENNLVAEISKVSAAPGLKQYLNRISDVMKGKYSLVDKFAVISIFLDGENDIDITTFKNIKKTRDEMFHGQAISEASLPNRELQRLFAKYFRSHMSRRNA
jgi:hypothetical protein